MLNKIGKVFKSSKGLVTPKTLKSNVKGGRLKAGLGIPNNMQKLARNLNNIDDTVSKVNASIPGKVADKLYANADNIATFSKNVETVDNHKLFKPITDGLNKGANALNKEGRRISKYDKAVGFDLKRAVTNDLKLHANQAVEFAGSMFEKSDKNLLGIKLNTKGKLVAGGLAVASGSKQAAAQFNETTMGTQRDSQITSHAPRIPSYANNGGATGDLVFALNANRKG